MKQRFIQRFVPNDLILKLCKSSMIWNQGGFIPPQNTFQVMKT